jgi:uncharacterized protein (DUF433 family)
MQERDWFGEDKQKSLREYFFLQKNAFYLLYLNMNWQQYVVSDTEVLLGKPTIKGTRISVDHIVSLLAQGWTVQKILQNYPRLTMESLQAVFAYIYECLQDGLMYPPLSKIA